jgi:hypothetical protein
MIKIRYVGEISGSHGSEYEEDNLVGYGTV